MLMQVSTPPQMSLFNPNTKALFGLGSEFEGVKLSWFEMKVCKKLSCLD